jgi:hypothetical protein
MSASRRADVKARLVMWSGIAAATLMLVVLLARGWGRNAFDAAAGVLLLACVAACAWAVIAGRRAEREVRDEIAQWAKTRRSGAKDR